MIKNDRIEAFKIQKEVKDKLKKLADQNDRTLTDYIRLVLTHHVKRDQ